MLRTSKSHVRVRDAGALDAQDKLTDLIRVDAEKDLWAWTFQNGGQMSHPLAVPWEKAIQARKGMLVIVYNPTKCGLCLGEMTGCHYCHPMDPQNAGMTKCMICGRGWGRFDGTLGWETEVTEDTPLFQHPEDRTLRRERSKNPEWDHGVEGDVAWARMWAERYAARKGERP